MSGGNLLARWERQLFDGGGFSLQTYFDHTKRDDAYMNESRNTADIDLNYRLHLLGNHELSTGGGYRWTGDDIRPGVTSEVVPQKRQDSLYSLFMQDDISLFDKRFHIIVGSKFEHNDYTGFEVQPSARLLWTPDASQSIWMSASRAVRTPSRVDHDIKATVYDLRGLTIIPPYGPVPLRTLVTATGSKAFKSEVLLAYEIGYRAQLSDWLSYDLTTFYNDYKHLRSTIVGNPTPPVFDPASGVLINLPLQIGNDLKGETFGVEAFCNIKLTEWWRVNAGYSWLRMNLNDIPSPIPDQPIQEYNQGAEHQFSIHSHIDLPNHFEFDPALYYVSRLSQRRIADYARLDLRLAWKPLEWVELSVKGENLLKAQHAEFGDDLGVKAMQIERSFFGQAKFYY
jgi:iron complex outermembrane receptor protein